MMSISEESKGALKDALKLPDNKNGESTGRKRARNNSVKTATFDDDASRTLLGGSQKTINLRMYKSEKRKSYTMTLRPSTHDKLVRLARRHSYKSTSRFLDDMIQSIDE